MFNRPCRAVHVPEKVRSAGNTHLRLAVERRRHALNLPALALALALALAGVDEPI